MNTNPIGAKRKYWLSRRSIFRLLSCITSMLLSFVFLEISCRLLGFGFRPGTATVRLDESKLHSASWLREAQLKHWIHAPYQTTEIVTNEYTGGKIITRRDCCGFREDVDTAINVAKGVRRVLVLGDSHTDGVCANCESYSNLLEAALNVGNSDSRIDVINAGQVTFSPYQEWWLYEKVGRHFSPNLVVVCFYAGNDYWDLAKREDRVHLESRDEVYVHVEPISETFKEQAISANRSRLQLGKAFLREHFASYHALAEIKPLRAVFGNLPRHTPSELRIQSLKPAEYAAYWQSMGQSFFFQEQPELFLYCDKMWAHVVSLLKQSTQRDNAELLILILPSLREIAPEEDFEGLAGAVQSLGLEKGSVDCDSRVRIAAASAARDCGVEVIDLSGHLAASRRADPKLKLFYRFDHHLAPDGHRVVSQVLMDRLRETLHAE